MMFSGAAVAAVPAHERFGLLFVSIGLLGSVASITLGRNPVLQMRQYFVRFVHYILVCVFLFMALGSAIAGIWNTYDCLRLYEQLELSVIDTFLQSLGEIGGRIRGNAGVYVQVPDQCFFGFIQLNTAAACGLLLRSLLRDIRLTTTRKDQTGYRV